jgi:hypothetical protein
MHALQVGVADRIVDHDDGARLRPHGGDRIEGRRVLGAIGRGLHDDVAARPDALLKAAVILDRGVTRPQRRTRVDLVLRTIDVMVAVAGVGRRLQLGGLGALRPFDLLRRGASRHGAQQNCGAAHGHCLQNVAAVP